jgi:thiol-disulfide isomerase/thioredoxin
MPVEVQIISAPWCKRCQTIKPEVAALCTLSGATLTYVEYEEMEEDEKATITSLPTIRMRDRGEPWSVYTATTLEEWKAAITKTAIRTDGDF